MAEHCLCGHEEFGETSLHDGCLPVYRCKKCGLDFTDEDLTRDTSRYAASKAGADDDDWQKRYAEIISTLGYAIIPWPAHLQAPHAASEADKRVRPPRQGIDMLVVDGPVLRAMARALEGAI
jgi:hypothetical protein